MASKNGKSSPDLNLKDDLLAHGREFSFFQALRLLTLLNHKATAALPQNYDNLAEMEIQVRPELSLAFPISDVAKIEELPGKNGFALTATFLGLYGASSALPTFYTEDLFSDVREDSTAARDFADILHRRIYMLLFDAWKKYRMFIQVAEGKSAPHFGVLLALSGLSATGSDVDNMDELYPLLRYTGLFGCNPRSALGMQTILIDFLQGDQVEIIPCIPRQVKISQEQRLELGNEDNKLGVNALIGEELVDNQGKFRVRIGPLKEARFRDLLPGGNVYRALTGLIKRYMVDPLQYDFDLILADGEAQQVCLGAPAWSRLGLDTVLFTGKLHGNFNVVFPPDDEIFRPN